MTALQIKRLLRKQPYQPIRLTLTDGCRIDIRHPRQILVTMRMLFIATSSNPGSSMRLATPSRGNDLADDVLMVNLAEIIALGSSTGAP